MLMTGIILKPGESQRSDIKLGVGNWGGCCEYAASPLKTPQMELLDKKKPLTYSVGEADDKGTFQGIAKLVYGDSKMWIQIFEANRGVVEKPGPIPYGASIVIPPRKHPLPKMISKITPEYPPDAL